MAEPLTGMLSPNLAEEFSHPYVERIVDAVQDDSFAVIYHNCGNNVCSWRTPSSAGAMAIISATHPAGGHAAPRPGGPAGDGQCRPGGAAAQRYPRFHPAATLQVMETALAGPISYPLPGVTCPMSSWENIDASSPPWRSSRGDHKRDRI